MSKMSDEELAGLAELAESAEPDADDDDWADPGVWVGLDAAVARYLAGARPSVLLRLLAHIDALAAELEDAKLFGDAAGVAAERVMRDA